MSKVIDNELMKMLMQEPVLLEKEHFLVKFAETPSEIEAAKRLRYDVFMAEQGHLAEKKAATQIDEDKFDPYCLHLIIVNRDDNDIIGTYRVHPGVVATQGLGFYSEQEFKFEGLDKIAHTIVEVGRSCVKPEYRNGAVVALLWSGMAAVHARTGCKYLLGCVSLSTTDPAIGYAVREYMRKQGDVFTKAVKATPQDDFKLPMPAPEEIDAYVNGDRKAELRQWLPPLLKGYLRLGAKFGEEPVLDKEFGTIDFLVLFDFDEMVTKYARHFL
jgi:putative hemolysin